MGNIAHYNSNAMFVWEDGDPSPVNSKRMQKDQINKLIFAAAALPYRGKWDADVQAYVFDDPALEGMTNAEAIVYKSVTQAAVTGDQKLIENFFDRTLGKPKQSMESVGMQMSLAEFLEQSAKEEAENAQNQFNGQTIDVTPDETYDALADDLDDL